MLTCCLKYICKIKLVCLTGIYTLYTYELEKHMGMTNVKLIPSHNIRAIIHIGSYTVT